ncbi:MAG: glycosyltransferase [Clostridia bacterium]|nr:glycosyltransferase [Clostridia bacterium]
MSLDILFLGRLFPREKEDEIKSKMKTGMQDAANALQWNIIDGFEENDFGTMKIINYLPVDAYPNGYTDKFIDGFTFQHTGKYDAQDVNVSCCNIFGIKRFINKMYFKKYIKKWAKEDNGKKKVILSYTATSMFLSLVKLAKKYNKSIISGCIIADIPEFATASTVKGIKKLYHRMQVKKCANLYGNVDRYVLLTEQMAQKLKIESPHIVVEGIATTDDSAYSSQLAEKYQNEKYILYSGTLNYKFGIGTLLDAFEEISDPDVKLMICGFGEAEELIKEKQKNNNRIIFLGRVDRKDVLELQKRATVLVNPRQNNEEFTKYSFPSKNLEYLSSGVPLVAYKLDGIPDEYDGYINYPTDDSAKTLSTEILKICALTDEERTLLGKKAKDFVFTNKNKVAQAQRIIEFIK